MDLKLKDLSYDELLELYQEEVNFIDYLRDLEQQMNDKGDSNE